LLNSKSEPGLRAIRKLDAERLAHWNGFATEAGPFFHVDGQFTPLSKPFRTKEEAEKVRSKYPHRERGTIGVGVIRTEK